MKDGAADKRLIEHWASFLIKKKMTARPHSRLSDNNITERDLERLTYALRVRK